MYSFVVPLLLDQLMIHLNNDGNLRKALEIDTLVLKLKYRRSRGVAVNKYPAVVVPAKIFALTGIIYLIRTLLFKSKIMILI